MRAAQDIRWLERAVASCATSAVAYKAAFMLAGTRREERDWLALCTGRYALLERLLSELQSAAGPAYLRHVTSGLDADPSCYADSDDALAAALTSDRALQRALARRSGGSASGRALDALRSSLPVPAGASA
jgi:hypothetical protein